MQAWRPRSGQLKQPVAWLLLAALLVGAWPGVVQAEAAGSQLIVVGSTSNSITVSLEVTHYEIETLSHDGKQCQRVDIPGATQTAAPGAPQAPERGALLGVPTTEGVTLRVLDVDYQVLSPYQLCPAPRVIPGDSGLVAWEAGQAGESVAEDSGIYGADSFWPAVPAELGTTGYLRDQAVAQVVFHPVQHNPVRREIRIYRRIVVQVMWPLAAQANMAADLERSTAFESLLRETLANYGSLGRRASEPFPSEQSPLGLANQDRAVVAAAPALKIAVNQDGLYRLTYADLENAGFHPGAVDPRTIVMTNAGTEIPIVVPGEGDGRFDAGDEILFYGRGIRDAYTTTNVYWLSAGARTGRRMPLHDGSPRAGPDPSQFPVLQHAEEDTAYWQTMPGQAGEDRWFWGSRLSPNTQSMSSSRDYTVHLGAISLAATTAKVRVRWKGYTGLAHLTRIWLNDHVVDERGWLGQVPFDQEAAAPHAWLHSGDNVIRVETLDAGAAVDQVLLNWIEIEYWSRYQADGDQLSFGAATAGWQRFEIGGFAAAPIGVFDVTDPANPAQVVNAAVTPEGSGYKVAFGETVQANSRYLALSRSRFLAPASISLDRPSDWRSEAHAADYIIITYEDFYDSALALADFRRASGLRVAVVKVGDVYDEFNYGVFNPRAIRDFLKHAYENWAPPAPAYVLLLGDADQDYKDNLHNGTRTYVPSQNIESSLFGEVSSDHWFTLVSGPDDLPDLFIGRLPAQTSLEASVMVSKAMNYERFPPDRSWSTKALFVADDDESDFARTSDQLIGRLPYYYSPARVYARDYPPGDPRADIVNAFDSGSVLVSYIGHGEYYSWGRWNGNQAFMFQASDVPSLANSSKLPIVAVGNCLNGFFAGPKDNASLAEVLLRRENGGAVAMWAPTGLGYSNGHRILLDEFYTAIFQRDQLTLGAATTSAKIATYGQSSFWSELIATYVLFGDPATQIGIPPNFPYVLSTKPGNATKGAALDQAIEVHFSKSMNPGAVTLSEPGGSAFEASWNADFTALTASHPRFRHNTFYQITVQGRDGAGNQLGPGIAPNPWGFTTTTDATPPSVTLSNPGHLTGSPVQLVFSEPVRRESVTYSITPAALGSLTWQPDRRGAAFIHERLQPGETYTFTLVTAEDDAGNSLLQPVDLSFTVVPTFYSHLPAISR